MNNTVSILKIAIATTTFAFAASGVGATTAQRMPASEQVDQTSGAAGAVIFAARLLEHVTLGIIASRRTRMNVYGLGIVNVFAVVWAEVALASISAPLWLWLVPPLVAVLVIARCLPAVRKAGDLSDAEEKRIRRLIAIASGIEGIAILIAASVLANVKLGADIAAAIAVIVGLHFIPLALKIPIREYLATAGLLIIFGLLDLAAPIATRAFDVCLPAALTLWCTALWNLRAPRKLV